MSKTSKIIMIIGVLCMLVPFMVLGSFASAETVTSDVGTFVFRQFNPRFVDGTSLTYTVNNSNNYFGLNISYPFSLDYFADGFLLANTTISIQMEESPLVDFVDDYAFMFFYPFSTESSVSHAPLMVYNEPADSRLHAYSLIVMCRVSDVLDPSLVLTINGRSLYEHSCSVVPLSERYDDSLGVTLVGSTSDYTVGNSGNYPYSFVNIFAPVTDSIISLLLEQFDFYLLTWYGVPSGQILSYSFGEELYNSVLLLSYFDMVSFDVDYDGGFNQGYQVGFDDGEQQANSTVNTGSASYQAGVTAGEQQANSTVNTGNASYQAGVTAGKQQANNTVNTGSASYIKGYQDGLDAPEYSFMSLISSIIDAPIRAFFGYTEDGVTHPGLFNFNILGYDMSNLVLSIFSLCVLITILRLILGGK